MMPRGPLPLQKPPNGPTHRHSHASASTPTIFQPPLVSPTPPKSPRRQNPRLHHHHHPDDVMEGPVEVTLRREVDDDESDDEDYSWYYWTNMNCVLCIGRDLASVGVTITASDEGVKSWFRRIAPLYLGRRLRATLVVGLAALRGRAPPGADIGWLRAAYGRRGHPQDPDNPIRCIVICVGGSHALVYQPWCDNYKHTGGLLPFHKNKMVQLRTFLGDKRISVACFGARDAAEKLAKEWKLCVARPVELTDLFARAFGKVAGVDPKKTTKYPEQSWTSRAVLRRVRAKAEAEERKAGEEEEEVEYRKQGKRPAKVVMGLTMERMARVAVGPEMSFARWPEKAANADWGGHMLDMDDLQYAARDAYLCFEIAARCLPKLGKPVDNCSSRPPLHHLCVRR